ncbi:hypothetical protein [Actinomyces procaprae]|uniref:hypothetical protein n=1 Tax=Actinomyces procaprae TaxID=2560010 RepID=UPI00109E35AB|nr:hypothetical protein [Actinomyces procaprae]
MSTTIDVYSTTDVFPLVHQTRARTEELFRELLARHGIDSTLYVTAFYPLEQGEEPRMVPPDMRWTPGLEIGFGYWLNAVWDCISWPECIACDDDELLECNGETAEEFFAWWGDHRIAFYGKKRFLRSHAVNLP